MSSSLSIDGRSLKHFREHYGDDGIGKWDIFYYVYGVLHHPGYREKFADNLKRELPRIPLAPPCDPSRDPDQSPKRKRGISSRSSDKSLACASGSESNSRARAWAAMGFWRFADAGRRLAELHIEYEALEPWPLEWLETPGQPLSYHVEKMRLSKDKKSLKVNDSLTLGNIPPEVFDYRLGNRSALEWVIDQYRVKEDKRSGIRSDPNNADDPEYIVRLVGQVVRVSVDTVKIVAALPHSYAPEPEALPTNG